MISVQYINLDMTPSGTLPVVYMSQYDVGRPIGLNVYSAGTAVDLSGYTITIEATRTDGTAITTGVSISGNIAFFVTTATMTNKADKYNAQLILVDSNARRVGSIPMIFLVVPASMDEDAESIEEDKSLFQQYTETVMSEIAGIHNADNTMSAQIAQIVNRGGAVDIQHGFVNVSVEATSSAEFSVNFGHAFSTTPNVVCTVRHGSEGTQQIVKIKTITTTGFTGSVYNYHTIGTANTQVEWIAVTGLSDVNAEISDAHVGADGTTYGSLGNAIRGQVTDLQEQIDEQVTDLQDQIDEQASDLQDQIDELANMVEASTDFDNSFKIALLACFQHVAWTDENGQDYYDALYDALYNIPQSITAIFIQGSNVIYNTDFLSKLRQYLVVTATYEDETTAVINNYTLSGTLAVGTSTITASYKGKKATFDVTVTQAESWLDVTYTPSGTVYTVDKLDDLKNDLVVKYFQTQSSSGVILDSSEYALVGDLVPGTSTLTAIYGNIAAQFTVGNVVDWYSITDWSSSNVGLTVAVNRSTVSAQDPNGNYTLSLSGGGNGTRYSFCLTKGVKGYYSASADDPSTETGVYTDYYPIPVPTNATYMTISASASEMINVGIGLWAYNTATEAYARYLDSGWKDSPIVLTDFSGGTNQYLSVGVRSVGAAFSNAPTINVHFGTAAISSLSAVFTQPADPIYDSTALETLRDYLAVTAEFGDGAQLAVTDYTLSGTLTVGTSVVTVTCDGLSTTFSVTVVSGVPSGYTRLKSVITDGLQYIDLGVNETQVESARYAMMITGVAAGTDSYGYGQHILSSSNTFFPLLKVDNGTTYNIMRNRKGNQAISSGSTAYPWTENVKYSVEAYLNGGNAVTFNGTQVFTLNAGTSASASNNFFLFTYGGNVSAGRYRFCGHLYYMVVYDSNGNILRNLIPAKNSSNVVGLYDTVTSTFYTSNTTYPLAAGEVAA